ncbi:TrkH family potassium uptake protein [Lampropedia puyangensis]|uniref:Trk system potassium uptake protein n=1 Tax=Lampropedia puyangensis TaxID=1330072 RepID=A0A4S8FCK7_9BURK|nr:potassium transporter TrkG [Lampropedia puyangensis]THU04585.1 TrkH family potassium uptake protein [Lampropedia puyangensis]
MQDFLPVLRLLCGLLGIFSATLCVPLATSILGKEQLWADYALPMLIGMFAGALGFYRLRHCRQELQPRHGIMLVTSVWFLLPAFAAIPIWLISHQINAPIGIAPAYFEAVSGLSTSGATVLTSLDTLPLSLNMWRTFMQWQGGMGILILAVAVLPMLGVGGSQVFKSEVAGPIKDTKLTPRITQTAKGLWSVYLGLSILCFLAYWVAGMPAVDALMHMFTTVSLGGLSSYDSSFGHFDSALLETISTLIMLIASCNFALYFVAMRKRSLRGFWREAEVRATIGTLVIGGLIISLFLWWKNIYALPEALRYGMFNTISLATTTGYATADYMHWPIFAPMLMLLLSSVASSAGSTGGGIKMIRALILLQQAKRELIRLVHPRVMNPVRMNGDMVDNKVIFSILAFILFYTCSIIVLSMLLIMTGIEPVTAFSAILASINCAGIGLADVGPSGNYSFMTDFQLSICSFAMLLGRLEILSVMVLLLPSFWRR